MNRYFISSSGTDIGKTFFLKKLCQELFDQNIRYGALKPIISGYMEKNNDAKEIHIDQEIKFNISFYNLYRFNAACSPDIAAEKEGQIIDFKKLMVFCKPKTNKKIQLIEGVGGIMTPITRKLLVTDWIQALEMPVILVVSNYLGGISHSLAALEVLKLKHIPVKAIIISEALQPNPEIAEFQKRLEYHTHAPIFILPRLKAKERWKQAPDLLKILL